MTPAEPRPSMVLSLLDEEPAAGLRTVAQMMRTRASKATQGEWSHECLGSEGCVVYGPTGGARRRRSVVARLGYGEWMDDHHNAEHVAGWSPAAATSVADWLDGLAAQAGDMNSHRGGTWPDGTNAALAVARAYLGGVS